MISIIIPCYWSSRALIEMTIECSKSVYKYTRTGYETIVVDDGSPLPLAALDTDTIITLPENKGYAGAVNAGVKHAKGDIYVILNNDTEVCPGWLEALTEPLENGYDIMSIRTSDADGFHTDNKITDNDKFGSVLAIKKAVWDDLGGFDEEFRGYFTDLDLYRRARLKGYKIGKNHASVILHHGKATYKEIDEADEEYLAALKQYETKHGVKLNYSAESW